MTKLITLAALALVLAASTASTLIVQHSAALF
jgi:hypothetical protein